MNKEKRQKPFLFRRIIAYLIDILIVASLSGAIRLLINKDASNSTYLEDYAQLVEKYNNKEITEEEYTIQSNELYYNNNVETMDMSIIMCGVATIYYVVLCYFCNGITLGKFLMKLKIESANGNELNLGNYLLRSLIGNLLLFYLTNIICIDLMKKETFISVYPKISNVLSLLLLATLLFMTYREDGRGIHDLIANTKIVSTKEVKVKEESKPKDIVEEAKVIEEKQLSDKKNNKKKKEVKKK